MTKHIYWLILIGWATLFHEAAFAQNTAGKAKAPKNKSAAKSGQTIAQIVATNPAFSTLKAALAAADLTYTLESPGPFTVFAPTDSAFKIMAGSGIEVSDLLKLENKDRLLAILRYHVVPGRLLLSNVKDGQKLKTIQTEELAVTKKDERMRINGGEVRQSAMDASNGIIYVIDKVLLPPGQESMH